jgi:DNA-directed RNA polymerase subunit L
MSFVLLFMETIQAEEEVSPLRALQSKLRKGIRCCQRNPLLGEYIKEGHKPF